MEVDPFAHGSIRNLEGQEYPRGKIAKLRSCPGSNRGYQKMGKQMLIQNLK
jgi:hypothetical protein